MQARRIGLVLASCVVGSFLLAQEPCSAQKGGNWDGEGPPIIIKPPRPPVTPPPVVQPPPPPPRFTPPPPPAQTFVPPLTTPFDAVNGPSFAGGSLINPYQHFYNTKVTDGIAVLQTEEFPNPEALDGPAEYILVRGNYGASYERPNRYSVKLEGGEILVSVRQPSKVAIIDTPLGHISLRADGDVSVSLDEGVVRIANLSGRGTVCKVKFNGTVFDGEPQKIITIAPGYEIVGSDHKITRLDLRPADGVARRGSQVLGNGKIALNEFQLESYLANSTLVAQITHSSPDKKEKRVMADMSKMAAILNHVNGTHGFNVDKTGLAGAGESQ